MARVWRSENANSQLLLYAATTALGWRVMRTIHRREGERGVERGTMREVHDSITGKLLGYQVLSVAELAGDRDLPSLASSASITSREMRLNAGEMGASRTAGLPEAKRLERAEKRDEETGKPLHLPPEDEIERARCKVLVFPRIGSAVGDILRVWPRGQELPAR